MASKLKLTELLYPTSTTPAITINADDTVTFGAPTTTITNLSATSITDSGNLTFTGTGNRIRGDFSNATVASRVAFQTSTTNGNTFLAAYPNGTGTSAGMLVYNNSDITNAAFIASQLVGTTEARINSGITGSGTYLPMTFYTGGGEAMRITTDRNVGIGTTTTTYKTNIVYTNSAGGVAETGLYLRNTSTGNSTQMLFDGNRSWSLLVQGSFGVPAGGFTIQDNTAGAARLSIDSSGNVGINTTSPAGITNRNFVLSGAGVNTISMTAGDYSANAGSLIPFVESFGDRNDANTSFGGRFGASYRRSDGTAIASGFSLGYYAFGGQWGTDTSYQSAKHLYSASIVGVAEGSFTSASAMPTAITFRTGSTGESLAAPNMAYGTERMRIDSSGNLLVGTTSATLNESGFRALPIGSGSSMLLNVSNTGGGLALALNTTADTNIAQFNRSGSSVGTISVTSSATAYNTSSDYRLKENVAPMTGALEKVAALKPCTYTWKTDGSAGQGFIAHELQAVVPDCVSGTKDAVDAEGKPQYQGVDTSFLVATLVAAIQELKAEIDLLKGN